MALIIPKQSRLKYPLDVLIAKNMAFYYGDKVLDIDIKPIVDNSLGVTEYSGKSVQKGRFSADDMLILPRTIDELPRRESFRVGSINGRSKCRITTYFCHRTRKRL
jgi:hypothetical protein